MLRLNRLILNSASTRSSTLLSRQLGSHEPPSLPLLPSHHLAHRTSTRFLDIYQVPSSHILFGWSENLTNYVFHPTKWRLSGFEFRFFSFYVILVWLKPCDRSWGIRKRLRRSGLGCKFRYICRSPSWLWVKMNWISINTVLMRFRAVQMRWIGVTSLTCLNSSNMVVR